MQPRGLADTGASREGGPYSGLQGIADLGSAYLAPLGPGPRQPGLGPFYDHCPFEIAEDRKHAEQRSTGGRAGIEALLMQIEFATARLELGKEANEVLKRSTEPVDGPSRDHIDFAPCDCAAQSVEARSLFATFGAADAFVAVCGDNVPTMALCGFEQFALLVGDGLLASRDPQIETNSHSFPPSGGVANLDFIGISGW
jgi:hypothetical protein